MCTIYNGLYRSHLCTDIIVAVYIQVKIQSSVCTRERAPSVSTGLKSAQCMYWKIYNLMYVLFHV